MQSRLLTTAGAGGARTAQRQHHRVRCGVCAVHLRPQLPQVHLRDRGCGTEHASILLPRYVPWRPGARLAADQVMLCSKKSLRSGSGPGQKPFMTCHERGSPPAPCRWRRCAPWSRAFSPSKTINVLLLRSNGLNSVPFTVPTNRSGDVRAGDVLLLQVCWLHGDAPRLDRHPQGAQVCRRQPGAGCLGARRQHSLQRRQQRQPGRRPRLPQGG